MEYWIITDTHFGHDNIIKYCGRPPEYSKMILKNISDTVNQGEVLVHLGDFCIGNDVYWHGEFMRQSHCKKWLIRGNHDSKTNGWYLDHGWDFVGCSVGIEVFG
jgi:calcineurin-like phosphoesterase family protein